MTVKKSALGKGLSALLENADTDVTAGKDISGSTIVGSVAVIELNKIEPNPFQPRSNFDESELNALSESIKQQGIIQPITVRKLGYDKYQIISGERRFKASRLAGLESIPAYIRIANDQGMLEMALVENIQRENLNAIEIAISYKRLIEECTLSQEELASRVGKERSTVTNYLRLLKLPPQIQVAIRDGKITMGHARAIINVDDIAVQLKIFRDIIENDLSVRDVENIVRATPKKNGKEETIKERFIHNIEIKTVQNRLSEKFETKVELKHQKNGSGKIFISYYSTDDLNRLLDILDA